jgi:hypothetical protein
LNSCSLKGSSKPEIHTLEGIATGRQISLPQFNIADLKMIRNARC